MLNPYKVAKLSFSPLQEIGAEGRNSRTFIVNDVQLGADIVMKQMPKADFDSPKGYFAEARALYASAHQNVVQVHFACEDDDHVFIAMPLYRKGSVKALMAKSNLTVREVVRMGCQVLSGLHNIHSKGLIHFDIKPDNILLSNRGEALLSDFGLARHMNSEGMAELAGLYIRMAPPESAHDYEFDLTYDIYQIGLTLYRMCNGNEAFYDQLTKYMTASGFDRDAFETDLANGKFPDRKAYQEHIPAKLRKIINRCIDVEPGQRFRSALAVANALADIDGNCLDWRLTQDGGNRIWVKNENGTKLSFTVKENGSTEFIKTFESGRSQKSKDGCRPSMNKREIENFLGSN
jgi:serine/threonine protein kinase